jgi:hypothetical protein
LPAAHGVALFAVRPQLPPVNVRVAVLASLSYICENWLDVALDASDPLVHAAERVARLIVIEFRDRADRPPSLGGVTVLAGYIQIPVRAVRTSGFLCLRNCRKSGKGETQHSNETKDPPPTKHDPPPAARHFTRKRQEDV